MIVSSFEFRVSKAMACVAAMLAAAAFAAPKEKPVRVDFTSQPEEASVILDGTYRGTTPLTVFDIAPGQHLSLIHI